MSGDGFVMPQMNVLSTPFATAVASNNAVKSAGDAALKRVEWFGSLVSRNADQKSVDDSTEAKDESKIDGTGGTVYSKLAKTIDADENKERQVWAALANLEKDSKSTSKCDRITFGICGRFGNASRSPCQQCSSWT